MLPHMIRRCLVFTVIIPHAMVLKKFWPATKTLFPTSDLQGQLLMHRWLRLQLTLWRRAEASTTYWLSSQMARLNPKPSCLTDTVIFPMCSISFVMKVTRSVNTSAGELSSQEQKTIKSIVDASSYPLSIVLIGVGDGPWEDMQNFDDKIPAREFDNFQFVNFTAIMSKNTSEAEKETAFALAALMEIPIQYKAAVELGIMGRTTGRANKIVPRPPPVPYSRRALPERQPSHVSTPVAETQTCPICLTNAKDLAFGCGHMTCRECGSRVSNCPICRQRITNRLRLFT